MKKYTIEEFKNYILKQDSRGDIMRNLSEENIDAANNKIPSPSDEQCITNVLDNFEECYLIFQDEDRNYLHGELLPANAYVGGEEDGSFTNDSNFNFSSSNQAETWYNNKYLSVWAFDDENECMEFWDKHIGIDW